MAALEDLSVGARVEGIVPGKAVSIVSVKWHGSSSATVVYDDLAGNVGQQLLFRSDEHRLQMKEAGQQWAFDGDGDLFRLVSEAHRIRLAYLFDPLLAVHISNVEPLPHQIAAVYEQMLDRQPLRYLLADDPGAGKTIMAGLLIRELMLRGDLERCLIVCPASLADQWQDELSEKFSLAFDIVGRAEIEGSVTNNPFNDRNLVIARIDLLKQEENMARLRTVEWDLVVVDEAHKMSATYFGNDVKYTARYHLGELLGQQTRHLLLMTATPHRGKEEDFQLFMGLLDADRFEGQTRDSTRADYGDMMRRMLKEELVGFDGRPLFPERVASTVNYDLSEPEAELYEEVTKYVSEEMNRAERYAAETGGDRRKVVVGFALTVLQRRLASSPAAIHESLKRRLRRLEQKLEEARLSRRTAELRDVPIEFGITIGGLNVEDLEDDLEEETETEAQEIVDLASAARTVVELEHEIESLRRLTKMAEGVRRSGVDKKWDKLRDVLDNPEMFDTAGGRRKLVIFTEHRDTLNYLADRIGNAMLGRPNAVVQIHGGLGREERRKAQARFLNEPDALVLVATDAAGEGVNLQRAHLMINYDLPWNPNRIEQRFGRIHRFGQTEVCHLWNLVAHETREGAVYHRLFEKLEEEREALGGKVFDVLGRLFTEVALRDLMLEAIRYNTSDEVRAKMWSRIDSVWDASALERAIEDRALDSTVLTASRLRALRDTMERAEARKLVPHFIESFFVEAFTHLGGSISKREPGRYEIRHVPTDIRQRDRIIGRSEPITRSYVRICFDRANVHVDGRDDALVINPGHPLLDAVIDVLLERHRDVLRRGTILVDDADEAAAPRVMFSIESDVTDGRTTKEGSRRIISRRVEYVEVDQEDRAVTAGSAPYLDYRKPTEAEFAAAKELTAKRWLNADIEAIAIEHGISTVVDDHLTEVRAQRQASRDFNLKCETAEAFLGLVLPQKCENERYRADIFPTSEWPGKLGSGFANRQKWGQWNSLKSMAKYLIRRGQARNVYFALATYEGNSRKASSVRCMAVVWADFDVGPKKGYKTRGAALAAIKRFGLAPCAIVNSGRGYHAYWLLETPAQGEDLRQLTEIVRGLAALLGSDGAVADTTRVLRVPGTLNIDSRYNSKDGMDYPVELVFIDEEAPQYTF